MMSWVLLYVYVTGLYNTVDHVMTQNYETQAQCERVLKEIKSSHSPRKVKTIRCFKNSKEKVRKIANLLVLLLKFVQTMTLTATKNY